METTSLLAPSGARIELDSSGVRFYDDAGQVVHRVDVPPSERIVDTPRKYGPLTRIVRRFSEWAWRDDLG